MTVSRETLLQDFAEMVIVENDNQNLVAPSTVENFHQRHLADSLQLADLAANAKTWIDIGSGAGLPGIPVAIALPNLRMTLVEPRSKRAAFLQRCVDRLDLKGRVDVRRAYVERITCRPVDVISARAVASLPKLFAMAIHLAHPTTTWLLPKGRSGMDELREARDHWDGEFDSHVSITSPDSTIIRASNVRRRMAA